MGWFSGSEKENERLRAQLNGKLETKNAVHSKVTVIFTVSRAT